MGDAAGCEIRPHFSHQRRPLAKPNQHCRRRKERKQGRVKTSVQKSIALYCFASAGAVNASRKSTRTNSRIHLSLTHMGHVCCFDLVHQALSSTLGHGGLSPGIESIDSMTHVSCTANGNYDAGKHSAASAIALPVCQDCFLAPSKSGHEMVAASPTHTISGKCLFL